MNEFGEVLNNISLKDYNTYKIGGNTKYLVKPFNVQALIELIKYLNNNNIKYFVLGGGSNVILPDEDYDGCVILLSNINNVTINDFVVNVEAGINLNKFIMELVNNNLSGLENLYGIPGTLGGAIIGNAGCHGSEISELLISVTYLENDIIKTMKKEECKYSYRNSIFKGNKNIIVLSAIFNLKKGNKEEMLNIMKENQQKRINSQPLEYPNAGSVFKNPKDNYAGKLISDANLKDFHINDAYISNKHANFIINKGNATSHDIIELINQVKKEIKEKNHIDLELEQEIINY